MPSSKTLFRWVSVEFFGTAILAMAVSVMVNASTSLVPNPAFASLFLPFGVGLTLFVLAAVFGKVSSAHFNPAVTLGQLVFKKVGSMQAVLLWVGQFLGAWAGVAVSRILLHTSTLTPAAIPNSGVVLGEFVGAFILSLTVMMVTLKKVEPAVGPFAIGSSLALGVALALAQGGGILNPALALPLAATHWAYLLMPLLGGIGGAALAVIFDEESDTPQPKRS
jgi:glycerol uptake facilitator protein